MGYPWEDLEPGQFERFAVKLCRHLFGLGVSGFATGPDGGRDARFNGVAERYPSATSGWSGCTIIQAKHTNFLNAHIGDAEFFSLTSKTCVIAKEVPRVKSLFESGELDNYLIITNRRVGANAQANIRSHIASATGLDKGKIDIIGLEYLEDVIHETPHLGSDVSLQIPTGGLLVSSQEIAKVVEAVHATLDENPAAPPSPPVKRTRLDEKNDKNGVSQEFSNMMTDRLMPYEKNIRTFLANPMNAEYLNEYQGAVDEFEERLVAARSNGTPFEDAVNGLVANVFRRDAFLAKVANKRLTRALVYYMYWNCDLGTD